VGVGISGTEYFEDEATIVSKPPNETFAKETPLSQAVEEAVAASEKIVNAVENKEELLKQQDAKIKKAKADGVVSDSTMVSTKAPERVVEFNRLKFFAKKTRIARETDKAFLGELLVCVSNENVKALVRQRLNELK
jgi:hypothetical protein